MKIPVSVTILTKNSQKYLNEVLASVASFDEVVVCDTGSEDKTLEIARKFPNTSLYSKPFIGFGPTHNIASSLAKNDWILSVDSDEVVTPLLKKEVEELVLKRGHVYSIPRHNEYRGKWIRWCGWHPDRCIRLYNRLDTRFSDAQLHECVEPGELMQIALQFPLRHYSYDQIQDFLNKMQIYSSLFALQNQGKQSSSFGKALSHGFYTFFKSYFLKRGVLGGQEGFEISFYNASTTFYKYLKLAEANRKLAEKSADAPTKKPTF